VAAEALGLLLFSTSVIWATLMAEGLQVDLELPASYLLDTLLETV
jgi:hypothetical protein